MTSTGPAPPGSADTPNEGSIGAEPCDVLLNPEQLIEELEALGGEAVELELSGPESPVVLHATGLRYCLMPLDAGASAAPTRSTEGQTRSDEDVADQSGKMATRSDPRGVVD